MAEDWTSGLPEAAQAYLENRRLDEVECIVADLPGIARGKAVPATKFARQEYFHLPDSIFYQTITGDWGEAAGAEGFIERDMILTPDMSTATAAPWTGDWTLQVIHDAYDRDRKPIHFAPRNVLKRVVQQYEKLGLKPVVAPEMEFFLIARNLDPRQEIEPMVGRSGRPAAARQAYSMTAVDEFGPVIDDIYDFAEAQGFEIDGITQEGGAGQLEINLRHGNPVKLADEVFYFKRLIREAALRHDCFATFMAKPIAAEPGSAMHIHHSIIDMETGKNAFSGPQGGETDMFYHFIGGLQEYMPAAIGVMAPYVNSYRRYVKDNAAPINLEWGATTGPRAFACRCPSRRRGAWKTGSRGWTATPIWASQSAWPAVCWGSRTSCGPSRSFGVTPMRASRISPTGWARRWTCLTRRPSCRRSCTPSSRGSIPSSSARNMPSSCR